MHAFQVQSQELARLVTGKIVFTDLQWILRHISARIVASDCSLPSISQYCHRMEQGEPHGCTESVCGLVSLHRHVWGYGCKPPPPQECGSAQRHHRDDRRSRVWRPLLKWESGSEDSKPRSTGIPGHSA